MRKIVFACFLICFFASFFILFVRCSATNKSEKRIEVPIPYLKVLSKFSEKNNLEKILASNGGVLVSKEWGKFNFSIARPPFVSTWHVDAEGEFVIKNSSGHINGEFKIFQTVNADRSGIFVVSGLLEPNGYVKKHLTKISIIKNTPVVIDIENEIEYERIIPRWMKNYLEEKVNEYNDEYTKNISKCIQSIMDAP